ncbi:pentatricopeptide repeat-containing protein At4g39530-like [Dioscorea cayenensis subsp. rotundata]|uniref:Pentatricopeptide repeat-containing protein At4g39530-like n=1 Tax=Dioscorea cayennensis subsp. rotundata TaxID=55577 RepID=A0AB40BTA8_DIOCR|nr:pentatricopeptide repeat-containing protein At4g39530-like [Dioscorea cayenensis subsp. rotundata]
MVKLSTLASSRQSPTQTSSSVIASSTCTPSVGFVQNALQGCLTKCLNETLSRGTPSLMGIFLLRCFHMCYSSLGCMLHSGVALDEFSFTSICRSCLALEAFGNGLAVHCLVIKCGFWWQRFLLLNGLVEVYAKCHFLRESLKVFVDVEHKDIVLVNTLIGLLAKAGNFEEAFLIFLDNVLIASMWPERATFVNLLSGIDRYEFLREGMQNPWKQKNPRSWTTMIKGYANLGWYQEAINTFLWIYCEGKMIDNVLLACVLSVAADYECLQIGNQLHATVLKLKCESNPYIVHALIDMYAKCRSMGDALKLFQQIGGNRIQLFVDYNDIWLCS